LPRLRTLPVCARYLGTWGCVWSFSPYPIVFARDDLTRLTAPGE